MQQRRTVNNQDGNQLLGANDIEPFSIKNRTGVSPYVIVCEHAGRSIPQRLNKLGLSEQDLERHIAYDIGARDLSILISKILDATLILQNYSRLVCDCNRPPENKDSFIPTISEHTRIPGNARLSPEDRNARINEIFWPFHKAVESVLDERVRQERPTAIATIHSFTPVFKGKARSMHVGLLFQNDERLTDLIRPHFTSLPNVIVADNEPYALGVDTDDFTVPYHAERREIPYTELELRQDLIAEPGGQAIWAETISASLQASADDLFR